MRSALERRLFLAALRPRVVKRNDVQGIYVDCVTFGVNDHHGVFADRDEILMRDAKSSTVRKPKDERPFVLMHSPAKLLDVHNIALARIEWVVKCECRETQANRQLSTINHQLAFTVPPSPGRSFVANG